MKKPWTAEELSFLRREYPFRTAGEIAAALGRSKRSVRNQAYKLGLRKGAKGKPWTAEELSFLRREYPFRTAGEIAAALGCSQNAVWDQAHRLGLRKRARWSTDEIEFLRTHYQNMSANDIAQALGCTCRAVHYKARKLGLKKPTNQVTLNDGDAQYLAGVLDAFPCIGLFVTRQPLVVFAQLRLRGSAQWLDGIREMLGLKPRGRGVWDRGLLVIRRRSLLQSMLEQVAPFLRSPKTRRQAELVLQFFALHRPGSSHGRKEIELCLESLRIPSLRQKRRTMTIRFLETLLQELKGGGKS